MELEVAGRRIPLHVRRETVEPSPHTGRELACVHGWVVTSEEEFHDWLTTTLPKIDNQPLRSYSDDGTRGKWNLSWNSYAESAGIHTYTLILREFEELSIEMLVVAGMELHPYEYREEFSDEGLAIQAKIVGSVDELRQLTALIRVGTPLPVERRGIQDRPRSMRFGAGEWSVHEDRIKYRLILIDADADASARATLLGRQEVNNRASLEFYANFVERLSAMLADYGILPREEIEAAREAARMEIGIQRSEFWRVPDVDLL
ncbi:MAG TPA: hypothetical protein VFK45_02975 [Gammaproteobacteria bacterium]|nr:hypothetical protein [Gammaproteobacteria bacterium]